MRKTLAVCALLALAGLACNSALAVEITCFPEARPESPMSVMVNWKTDVPSDSLVEYGIEGIYSFVVYNSDYVTEHEVSLPLHEIDQIYDIRVTSADGGATDPATAHTWYLTTPSLATFQFPEEGDIVSGEVRLKGSPSQPRMHVLQAVFEVIPDYSGAPVLIGVDVDGTDLIYASEPAPEGDGWSAYWDTTGWPEGGYKIRVTLATAIGIFSGTRHVWLDHTPPFPEVTAPSFGERCYGVVTVSANGASGAQQVVFFEQQAPEVVKLPTSSFMQYDYNWDNKPGDKMCHPCTQASILWTNPRVRNLFVSHPDNTEHTEAGGKQILVLTLASNKRTDSTGTEDTLAKQGSILVLANLRHRIREFDWKYKEIQGPVDIKKLKKEMTQPEGKVRGVGINLRGPNGWGHTVALSKVDDNQKKDENGKPYYDVTFTNPATGTDQTYRVNPNGTFEYGTVGTISMGSGFKFTGSDTGEGDNSPEPNDGWQIIGTDTDPLDGWSVNWDATGKPPGLYFLKAEAIDPNGSVGSDTTEVAVPARGSVFDARTQPDAHPVDVFDCAVTHTTEGRWWIEAVDRSSGIAVTGGAPAVQRGDRLSEVRGSITTKGLERVIEAYEVVPAGSSLAIRPLGMVNRFVVGGDLAHDPSTGAGQTGGPGAHGLNNVGLLVRTFGTCLAGLYSPSGDTCYLIDDGSAGSAWPPVGIVLMTTEQIGQGEYVAATGICGLEDWGPQGIVPVLRARDSDDVMKITVPR